MEYNFDVRAGNTGTVKNEAGLELVIKAGTPPAAVDLSGDTFVFIARQAPGSAVLFRKASDAEGGIVVTALEGRVVVPFTVAETRGLWSGGGMVPVVLQYELERRRSSGSQRTVLSGKMTVLPGVNDDE
jgi:hypothetical protein